MTGLRTVIKSSIQFNSLFSKSCHESAVSALCGDLEREGAGEEATTSECWASVLLGQLPSVCSCEEPAVWWESISGGGKVRGKWEAVVSGWKQGRLGLGVGWEWQPRLLLDPILPSMHESSAGATEVCGSY